MSGVSRSPHLTLRLSFCLAAVIHLASSGVIVAQTPAGSSPPPSPIIHPGEAHHPKRLIVKFKAGVNEAQKENSHGKAQTKRRKRFNAFTRTEVRELGPKDLRTAIAAYRATGLVDYAEPDYVVRGSAVPNDPLYSAHLWQLENSGQSGGIVDADFDAGEAWDTRTASDTIVAVIDSGVRYTHEDLRVNMWTNPGEVPANDVDDDGNGYIDDVHGINAITGSGNPNDDNGHGTHVAGSIGAVGNNGKGVTGVAWAVKIMACKFLDSTGNGYTSDAIEALDYARLHGATVLNNSWGGGAHSQALLDALDRCAEGGAMIVVAAGNDAANNDALPTYPANYSVENMLAVAATNRFDGLASFSNFGANTVEIAAPGQDIVSTYHLGDSSYAGMSGTSMAAPQVAGLLALVRAQFPADTSQQVLNRILQSVDSLPALAGKTRTGGRINAHVALTFQRPANDAFDFATEATGDSFEVSGSTRFATTEPSEPAHGGSGGSSVWWKWTAPAAGTITARTEGSDFDTVLAVYTGGDVANLAAIAANDNVIGGTASELSFEAVAETTYYFAVDGVAGATGSVKLAVIARSNPAVIAAELQKKYGFKQYNGSYYLNTRGQQEKYLVGTSSANGYVEKSGLYWYYILPNGDFYEFTPPYTTTALTGKLVARLGPDYYTNPALLTAIAPPVTNNPADLQKYGLKQWYRSYYLNTRGQQEKYLVGTSSANAYVETSGIYWYYILPNGDFYEFIPPYTSTLTGKLVARLGPDYYANPALLTDFAPPVTTNPADLQKYGLKQYNGSYYLNTRGQQEKYLVGTASATGFIDKSGTYWYYILPNGDFYDYTPPYTSALTGKLVGRLGPAYYDDPSLLTAGSP